jgi:hypothetical protein
MRFDRKKNPAALVVEGSRYATSFVAPVIYRNGTYLSSTDGRALIMVSADVDADEDLPRAIPAELIASARKGICAIGVKPDGKVVALHNPAEYPQPEGRFPDVVGVIPSGKHERTFSFDAALLAQVQKALGADSVTVEWHGDCLPMVIRPFYGKKNKATRDGSFAVQMPMSDS